MGAVDIATMPGVMTKTETQSRRMGAQANRLSSLKGEPRQPRLAIAANKLQKLDALARQPGRLCSLPAARLTRSRGQDRGRGASHRPGRSARLPIRLLRHELQLGGVCPLTPVAACHGGFLALPPDCGCKTPRRCPGKTARERPRRGSCGARSARRLGCKRGPFPATPFDACPCRMIGQKDGCVQAIGATIRQLGQPGQARQAPDRSGQRLPRHHQSPVLCRFPSQSGKPLRSTRHSRSTAACPLRHCASCARLTPARALPQSRQWPTGPPQRRSCRPRTAPHPRHR